MTQINPNNNPLEVPNKSSLENTSEKLSNIDKPIEEISGLPKSPDQQPIQSPEKIIISKPVIEVSKHIKPTELPPVEEKTTPDQEKKEMAKMEESKSVKLKKIFEDDKLSAYSKTIERNKILSEGEPNFDI